MDGTEFIGHCYKVVMLPVLGKCGSTCLGPHVWGMYRTALRVGRAAEVLYVCEVSSVAVCVVEESCTFVHDEDYGCGSPCYVTACTGHVIDEVSSIAAMNGGPTVCE